MLRIGANVGRRQAGTLRPRFWNKSWAHFGRSLHGGTEAQKKALKTQESTTTNMGDTKINQNTSDRRMKIEKTAGQQSEKRKDVQHEKDQNEHNQASREWSTKQNIQAQDQNKDETQKQDSQQSQDKASVGEGALQVRPCLSLRNRIVPEYVGSPHLKLHSIIWRTPLQNIYVVKKPWNEAAMAAMVTFINHIHAEYPALNVIVAPDVADELAQVYGDGARHTLFTGSVQDIVAKTDVIVTLGGDGTTLRAVSAFSNGLVPPVLSFAMGTLGFLLPFDFARFEEAFRAVFESRSKALHRTRLECHVVRSEALAKPPQIAEYEIAHYKQHHNGSMVHAMNDILLHRGLQPNLILLDIYIDSEFLTTTTADGIILASPTGSTAYLLSAGGSITHPLVPCILMTPVCPRLLSFRPLVLPSTLHVMIKLSDSNRNGLIKMNIDGIPQQDLKPGDEIHVVNENGTIFIPGKHQPPGLLRNREEFDHYVEPGHFYFQTGKGTEVKKGLFCVANTESDWIKGINQLLGFNSSFRGQKM